MLIPSDNYILIFINTYTGAVYARVSFPFDEFGIELTRSRKSSPFTKLPRATIHQVVSPSLCS